MLFRFKIDVPKHSIDTFEEVIENVFKGFKEKIERNGGTLNGDSATGSIAFGGVEGNYVVGTDCIEMIITKKPSSIFATDERVEKSIRKEFKKIFNKLKLK